MSESFPQNPRQELEAKITALLLGELSAEEVAAMHEVMAHDAELAAVYERLRATIALVKEAAGTPVEIAETESSALKLSEERRQTVLAQFKTVRPPEFVKRRWYDHQIQQPFLAGVAVMALIGLIAAALLPSLAKAKFKAQRLGTWSFSPQSAPSAVSGNYPVDGQQEALMEARQSFIPRKGSGPHTAMTNVIVQLPPQADGAKGSVFDGTSLSSASRVSYGGFEGGGKLGSPAGLRAPSDDSRAAGLQELARNGTSPPDASGAEFYRKQPGLGPVYPTEKPPEMESFRKRYFSGAPTVSPPALTLSEKPATATESEAKVPVLGDVPMQGQLLRSVKGEGADTGGVDVNNSGTTTITGLPASGIKSSNTFLALNYGDVQGSMILTNGLDSVVSAGASSTKRQGEEMIAPEMIDFRNADLNQVLDVYGELANRKIARPAKLPDAKFTLKTGAPLSKEEALKALDGALAMNGISMIELNDTTVQAVPAVSSGSATQAGGGRQLEAAKLETEALQKGEVRDAQKKRDELRAQLNFANPVTTRDSTALKDKQKVPELALLKKDDDRKLQETDAALAKPAAPSAQESVQRQAQNVHLKNLNQPEPLQSDAAPAKPAAPPPIPQPEILTRENAFSTFSLNVSDVSFKLAAASLEKGVMPEPASIRTEEFINAFDYRDPEPAPGAPISFVSERARYPFAQNRDLLRFSLKTAALGRQASRPLNLVLLLDKSGSMERADRVEIIREALRVLATQLQPQDTLSVVTFARAPRLSVDGVPGDQAGKVVEELSGITPEGGTNLEEAMNLAYQTALRHYLAAGINRVVLLTDGAANLGNVSAEALKQKVETNRKQGIALDCFGVGWEGYNDDLLEVLSRNGDGRYGFINMPEEAATEFAGKLAGALKIAASDVKVQVEFNPTRVTSFRQLGYAKHQLTKEQFRDNSVNAAQLGGAESGNALYVIEINPAGDGPVGTVRVRYRIPGTSDYREQEWVVPYTGSTVSLEQASPALRLAATASAFSEWLASSPYAADVTLDALLGYLRGVPEVYGADQRPTHLQWMVRQAKSLTGK